MIRIPFLTEMRPSKPVTLHTLLALTQLITNDMRRTLILLCVLFLSQLVWARDTVVRGNVKDAAGPLAGVAVIASPTVGTVTDGNGDYVLDVPSSVKNLVFSCIGYSDVTEPIGARTVIDVVMTENAEALDELVFIGYGTVRKKDLTGAVSVVDTRSMSKAPSASVLESLQGSLPGVEISMNARPGDTGYASIRGINSFTNINPLYVIDGLPTTNIRDFNPADIESIQVLKDASAAAIYGSRAANGVIVITTKKGSGDTRVNFSASYSIQLPKKYMDFAGSAEWVELMNVALDNQLLYDPGASVIRPDPDYEYDTDWWDEYYRTGSIQQYNVSLSGGTEKGNYYVSAEYYANDGVESGSSYDRLNFRVNTSGRIGIFSFGESLILSNNEVDPARGGTASLIDMAPVVPVYDPSVPGGGGIGGNGNACMGDNPLARELLNYDLNRNFHIRGTVWGELAFTDWLKYKVNVGYNMNFTHSKNVRKEGDTRWNQATVPSSISESRGLSETALFEQTLTFDRKFGKHAVTAMVGQTYQGETEQGLSALAHDVSSNSLGEYFQVLSMCSSLQNADGWINQYAMLSYLGRVTYAYDDKYLFNATFRRDGTSKVAKARRWGNFPSMSLAWRISRENFMQDITWLDDLKIRASYGELGGMNIGNWDYLALINSNLHTLFGSENVLQDAATQTKMVNTDLQWETQTQINAGIDASAFDSRLTMSADYYISKADNLLLRMPILMTTGNNGGNPYVNAASMENRGFELSLGWREFRTDYNYYVNLSATTGKNKVTSLGYGQDYVNNGVGRTEVGQPIGMFYLIRADGLFQSEEEVLAHVNSEGKLIQPKARPGDIRFTDQNDDGVINDADRVICGSPHSVLQLGLNMGFSYKNFDVKMNWFGDFGSKIFNDAERRLGAYSGAHGQKLHKENYWAGDNTSAPYPRLIEQTVNSRDSDYWLNDGSYLRLKNLTLSYALPGKWVEAVGLDFVRLSFTAQNLVTFGGIPFGDIEFRKDNIWSKGYRGSGAYPNPMTLNFGIQIQF